jgi:ubiquinone/menaquinone biosynthesis C-methylase UbiE
MTAAAAKDVRFWNGASRKYAANPIADVAGYERTLERTRGHLKPGDVVLEFGCGTGTSAVKLAPSVSRYVATDLAPAMIEIGRERAAEAKVGNITFEAGTPADDRFVDRMGEGAFDAVIAFNVLHLIVDRKPLLAGVRRLLKPGGRFISKTPGLSDMNLAMGAMIRVVVPVMQMIGKAPPLAFFSAKQIESEIEAAGFRFVDRALLGTKKGDIRPFLVAERV